MNRKRKVTILRYVERVHITKKRRIIIVTYMYSLLDAKWGIFIKRFKVLAAAKGWVTKKGYKLVGNSL